MSRTVIVMGVTGCGKTTVGRLLADRLDAVFLDADDFHPPANKDKISRGEALTDADREPWLNRLAEELKARAAQDQTTVLACSALKQAYRDRLTAGLADAWFVHLTGDQQLIESRVAGRKDHFAGTSIVASQFATLEPPQGERVITLDVAADPEGLANAAVAALW